MSYRIVMVGACPYPVPQGSQVLLRSTALALRDRGHDVHLVVYGYGVGADDTGLKVHRCARVPGARRVAAGPSLGKPVLDAALVAALRRVVREVSPDVVHAHNYEGLLVALAAGRHPIVYHAHNAMADELPHFLPHSRWMGLWLDRTFPRRADHIIAPHQRLADYLGQCGCASSKISVIPPCVDIASFDASTEVAETPPVLYTGNLDRYQNLDLLLRAMDRVRTRLPDTRLIIATAENRTVPSAEMVLTPDFPALKQVLMQDAVVACPRISWSGYPIKLLNAMAAGKAIVACQGAAYPLTHNHDGLVTPDNDEQAFADALVRLLTDRALRVLLGRNARDTIAARHAPQHIAASIERMYSNLS